LSHRRVESHGSSSRAGSLAGGGGGGATVMVAVVVAVVMVLVELPLAVIGTIVVADSQSHCCHRTGTSRSKCGYHVGMQVEAIVT
jgi:hypothetical protein